MGQRVLLPEAAWSETSAVDLRPGDEIALGRILEKSWGGPLGLDAWRLIVEGLVRPVWLASDQFLLARPTRVGPSAPIIAGVFGGASGSDPERVRTRLAAVNWARHHVALQRARR